MFYARTALSSDEILRDFYPNAEHAFESTRAVALAIDEFDRSAMPGDHISSLGYKNLIELSSKSYLGSDEKSDPHCQINELKNINQDIILLSGNLYGFFGKLFKLNKIKAGRRQPQDCPTRRSGALSSSRARSAAPLVEQRRRKRPSSRRSCTAASGSRPAPNVGPLEME